LAPRWDRFGSSRAPATTRCRECPFRRPPGHSNQGRHGRLPRGLCRPISGFPCTPARASIVCGSATAGTSSTPGSCGPRRTTSLSRCRPFSSR
jgi:hypothetical protein